MAGQTLAEIRSILAAAGLAPRHRYGQNFLIDLNLMRKLPAAAAVTAADVVLEVGPGTGSLTELLLETGARVVAVEIDHGLQALLRERLGTSKRFGLVQCDVLAGKHAIAPAVLDALRESPPASDGGYKLVANLPYQVATPLLMDLLQLRPPFLVLVCTIQREVGERLAAAAETDAYGPISVIAQSLATVEALATLPPTVFWPRPKVDSVMLRIAPLPPQRVGVSDVAGFVRFVHHGFQQRRKMLRSSLRAATPAVDERIFERAEISPNSRPEQLSPSDWRRLFLSVNFRSA